MQSEHAAHLPDVDDLALLLWLQSIPKVGPAATRALIKRFGPLRAIHEAEDFSGISGVPSHVAEQLHTASKRLEPFQSDARALLDKAKGLRISVITCLDDVYPPQLSVPLAYGPTVIFVAGDHRTLCTPGVAVVGTRALSSEATKMTRQAAHLLVSEGQTVVSGMAKGVDAIGHSGALEKGGKTVAVLGCGVDRPYPPENVELHKRIQQRGAVVSEYRPGTPPSQENLRRRNRLIVALSRAVVVAECPSDSGAMIAARAALQQQRPLFVLSLHDAGHEKQRSGTELLASLELAEKWDATDFRELLQHMAKYQRPEGAEARLDKALGKPPKGSAKPGAAGAVPPSRSPQKDSLRKKHQSSQSPVRGEPSRPDSAGASLMAGNRVTHATWGAGEVDNVNPVSGVVTVKFDNGETKKIAKEFTSTLTRA